MVLNRFRRNKQAFSNDRIPQTLGQQSETLHFATGKSMRVAPCGTSPATGHATCAARAQSLAHGLCHRNSAELLQNHQRLTQLRFAAIAREYGRMLIAAAQPSPSAGGAAPIPGN